MSHKIKEMLDDFYNNGNTSDEIIIAVINMIGKYFEHPDALRNAVTNSEILSVFEFEVRYYREPEFSAGIMSILKCYRDALATDPLETLNTFLAVLPEASEKENQMWTVRTNAPIEVQDDIYDLTSNYMRHIGDSLEIGVKYIIYELFAMTRIAKGKSFDYDAIRRCEFGVIITNLIDGGGFEQILKTYPNCLKLSDWRNIAYHHTYHIEDDMIICTYGKSREKIILCKKEFKSYLHQIIRSCNIINVARCIFAFDNLDKLISIKPKMPFPKITFRKPMLIEQLRISLMSQGFKLGDFQETESSIVVALWDQTNDGTIDTLQLQKREIHSSPLLYNIWCVFTKGLVKVIYCKKDGTQFIEYTVTGDICEQIHKGQPISDMIKHVSANLLSP